MLTTLLLRKKLSASLKNLSRDRKNIMPKKFDAILFDVDGTLLDSAEFIYQAFYATLLKHVGREVTREEIFKLPSWALVQYYEALAPTHDAQALAKTHREVQDNNLHLSRAFDAVHDVLGSIAKAGMKKAAVTNRGKETVASSLRIADILHHFDAIVTADDVKNPKPHPEPILKALNMLGIRASKAVMVGDTDVDIIAGKEAGVLTIGVTYGIHGKDIEKNNPDFLVHDIREILPIILDLNMTYAVDDLSSA